MQVATREQGKRRGSQLTAASGNRAEGVTGVVASHGRSGTNYTRRREARAGSVRLGRCLLGVDQDVNTMKRAEA